MNSYLKLMKEVLDNGTKKNDRTEQGNNITYLALKCDLDLEKVFCSNYKKIT